MSLPRPGTLPSRGISSAPDSPTASWPRGGRGPECGNRARGHPAVPAPPSPDAGTVPARGRAWGMQGRADPAPGVRGPVLVPAPPEQGLGRGRHGRPPCTLTHRRNEPTGKGACTRRGLGPARRQDQRPVAFPGRPISGRGRSASREDAPTPPPLLRSPVPGPLGPALVTKQSAGRSSRDCALCPPESGRAEPARGRGPHPHVPRGRRWGPHSGGSPHPFARHRAGYRPAYRGPRSESW